MSLKSLWKLGMVPLATAISVNIGSIETRAQRDKYDSRSNHKKHCISLILVLLWSVPQRRVHFCLAPRWSTSNLTHVLVTGYANPSSIRGYAVVFVIVAGATSFCIASEFSRARVRSRGWYDGTAHYVWGQTIQIFYFYYFSGGCTRALTWAMLSISSLPY